MSNQTRTLTRDELFALCGLNEHTNDHTPVTVGKNNKLGSAKYIWADHIRTVNFINNDELSNLKPEDVHKQPIFYTDAIGNMQEFKGMSALIGDETYKSYAIHSNVYNPVQHSVIVDGMRTATEYAGYSVFGNVRVDGSRFNGFANIANPDCQIKYSEEFDSPIMLGMRFYNSHDGNSRFGGEMYGIRKVCGNYIAMGEVLGSFSAKHYSNVSSLAEGLARVLKAYIDNIPTLADRIHILKDRVLTVEEQTAYLYGLRFTQKQVISMDTYKEQLNPEIKGDVSAYDMFNVVTAFNTYKTGSAYYINGVMDGSHKAETTLYKSFDSILNDGYKIWDSLKESQLAVA